MQNIDIVGIGEVGKKLCREFKKLDYNAISVDLEDSDVLVEKKSSHKLYEESYQEINFDLKHEESLVIISGGGEISGISLKLLKQLKEQSKKISILYIKPDINFLTSVQINQERLTRGVLQEYARSGVFERIILIDNSVIDMMMGGISVREYYEKINESIVFAINSIFSLRNEKYLVGSRPHMVTGARIESVGIVDFENKKESLFYNLDEISEKVYYCCLNSEDINTNNKIISKIKDRIRGEDNGSIKTSCGIYETQYATYYIVLARSSKIQL